MNGKFSELLSLGFLISQEMVKNHGEDNYYCKYSEDSAVICVLDGCGGLGSRTYEGCGGQTGAYLASRTVSGAIHDWYQDMGRTKWKDEREFMESLITYIQKAYSVVGDYAKSSIKISGSMVRDLPTTIALAYAWMKDNELVIHVVWAGDSRIYLMDEDGMCQLTRDDVKSQDALSNLYDDGALTNILSSDGNYKLHHKVISIKKPCVIIGATDGCFGYLPSPMNFEYEFLRNLTDAKNIYGFRDGLKSFFKEVAGDDFTFACMGFGYEKFSELKGSFEKRRNFVEKEYISKIESDPDNDELIEKLWQEYRKLYERYLSKNTEGR